MSGMKKMTTKFLGEIKNLKDIFEAQKERQLVITGDNTPVDDPLQMMLHCSCLVTEIGELMQEDKRWKMYIGDTERYDFNYNKKLEEFVDVLNYFVNMCLFSDVDFEELISAYNEKHRKLLEKYDISKGV